MFDAMEKEIDAVLIRRDQCIKAAKVTGEIPRELRDRIVAVLADRSIEGNRLPYDRQRPLDAGGRHRNAGGDLVGGDQHLVVVGPAGDRDRPGVVVR